MKSNFSKKFYFSFVFFLVLVVIGLGVCNIVFAEKVKIEFLQWFGSEITPGTLSEIISQFNEEYPEIEVVENSLPWSQIREQIIAQHSVGQIADVIGMNRIWTKEFIKLGIIEPLEEYFKNDKDLNLDDLVQVTMAEIDGHIWMAPLTAHPLVFYYNKDLFREAGLGTEAPKTWDEVKEYAIKLTNPEKGQFGYGLYFSSTGSASGPGTRLYPLLFSGGGHLVKDGKPNINSPEMIDTLKFLLELKELGVCAPGILSSEEQQQTEEFANGRIAMKTGTMPHIAVIQKRNPDLDFGIAPIPAKNVDILGTEKHGTRSHGWDLGITSKGKNKEAAWTFIKFLMSPEINAKFAKAAYQLPANYLAAEDDFFRQDPKLSIAVDIFKNMTLVEELMFIPNEQASRRAMAEELQAMFAGKQSPEETAKNAQVKWEEIFNQYNQ